ncbi:hypothetical protein ONE63_000113 [Megalurothrips usitatus]|uniref:Uncharacterized protein n=1 Tax=Megalurothrips usitatus TaxID=439358 RepID=A0AAV7Y1A8_9NEOP|nr:hypothetical protein ONE63_000113 [Megalurothrips usitatus]
MRLSARLVLLWWALVRPQVSVARRGETSLVPKYYDIRSCEDKPHRMNISNVTIVMGDDGEERINAVFQLGEAIRALNLVQTQRLGATILGLVCAS